MAVTKYVTKGSSGYLYKYPASWIFLIAWPQVLQLNYAMYEQGFFFLKKPQNPNNLPSFNLTEMPSCAFIHMCSFATLS